MFRNITVSEMWMQLNSLIWREDEANHCFDGAKDKAFYNCNAT